MKNKIKYTNEPIEARVISDLLPSPEKLILREKNEGHIDAHRKRDCLIITRKTRKFNSLLFNNSVK